jgi:hypothetical protein
MKLSEHGATFEMLIVYVCSKLLDLIECNVDLRGDLLVAAAATVTNDWKWRFSLIKTLSA